MRSTFRKRAGILAIAVVGIVAANFAWGLSESEYGNKPVSPENYKEWPGIVKVINDPYRVFRIWTNGNEEFWFHGDANAINAGLENFWRADLERFQVVLLPGPGQSFTYNGMTVTGNYRLHILGGIAKPHFEKHSQEDLGLFDLTPTFYIYINDLKELQELKIPLGVELVGPKQLRERYLAGLKKGSRTTRGHAASLLASIDAHNPETAKEIALLLDDRDTWLSAMAVHALKRFGANALPVLEKLEKHKPEQDHYVKALAEAIKAIKEAAPHADQDQHTRELIEKIDAFVAAKHPI